MRKLHTVTTNDIEMQPSPALSSSSFRSFKFQVSKVSLLKMFSSTPEKDTNPFTVLTIYQRFILIGSILLMIVVLQIPTVVYYTSTPPSTDSLSITDVIDFKTCSLIVNTSTTLQSTLTDFCPEVPPLINQDELHYNTCITISLSILQYLPTINSVLRNEQCNDSAVPFFCKAMYSLCGDDDNFTAGLMEECVEVRDNDCPIEWRVFDNIFNASLHFPSCESYTGNSTITFAKAPPLNCPDQFDEFCGSLCLPVCEEYSQVSRDAAKASDVLTVILIILGLIGGSVTLVACIFNREKMFKFPQVYVVYNTVNMMVILTFYVLPLMFGRRNFLCSDSNLIEALENPSGYCQAQGFVLQTGIMYFFQFLLFHMGHLLYAIAFPLKAKRFIDDYARIAHLIEMIIIIVLGLIPGTIILSVSEYQFDGFLPHLCIPGNRDVFFYTLILTIVIGATIGLSMLFIAFWILRQNRQLTSERSMKVLCNGLSSPEKKLFILFWYYILVAMILLALLTVELETANSISEQLQKYFICSAGGYKPECDIYRKRIKTMTWPSYFLDLASTLSLSFITLSNLTYVLQINDIKKKLFKLKARNNITIAS